MTVRKAHDRLKYIKKDFDPEYQPAHTFVFEIDGTSFELGVDVLWSTGLMLTLQTKTLTDEQIEYIESLQKKYIFQDVEFLEHYVGYEELFLEEFLHEYEKIEEYKGVPIYKKVDENLFITYQVNKKFIAKSPEEKADLLHGSYLKYVPSVIGHHTKNKDFYEAYFEFYKQYKGIGWCKKTIDSYK